MPGSSSTNVQQASRSALIPREFVLFLHALRLSTSAQKLRRGEPLKVVTATLASKPGLPTQVEPLEAERAAGRAGRVLQRFGYLNTCLVRSLVAGVLLSDRDEVVLHIGVESRENSRDTLSGHAWLSLEGSIIPSPEAARAPNGQVYEEMASLSLRRP